MPTVVLSVTDGKLAPSAGLAHGSAHVVDTATPGKARQPLCGPRLEALAQCRDPNQLKHLHRLCQPFHRDGAHGVDRIHPETLLEHPIRQTFLPLQECEYLPQDRLIVYPNPPSLASCLHLLLSLTSIHRLRQSFDSCNP